MAKRPQASGHEIIVRALAETPPPIKYKLFFISHAKNRPPDRGAHESVAQKSTGRENNFRAARL
ncbi:MAG: hypothetical protein CVT78_07785 [Alphaproteobacteria bacterium HGW-Alphaproteobacteria-17]|nr:MAG: hypothetical protein CVT78_07785 [Alphaproteobacteria bacterium HGW-Alphaproteobacteria-17]